MLKSTSNQRGREVAIETTRDRIIFLVVVPITTALVGAFATAYFTAGSCQVISSPDFITILKTTGLTSADKMKALAMYQDISDRPWSIVRTLGTVLAICTPILLYAYADKIKRG